MSVPKPVKNCLVMIVVLSIWGVMLSSYGFYTVDDAYIIFRYARNCSSGVGLVYNPGIPVDGYTSFLWTILLCIMFRIGVQDLDVIVKILGFLLGSITLFLVWRLPSFAGRKSFHSLRWVAPLLCTLAPSLVISSVEGLETSLYITLQMVLIKCWLSDILEGRLSLISGVWGGLLMLARPDGLLLVLLLLLFFIYFHRCSDHRLVDILRKSTPYIIGCVFIYLPYFLWHFAYYKSPFPNTFYAKSGGHSDQMIAGVFRIIANLQEIGGIYTLIPVLLALTGIVSPPYKAALISVILSRVAFHIWSGGEVMGHHRFLAPALPAYFLLFQLGLEMLDNLLLSKVPNCPRLLSWLMPIPLGVYMVLAPLIDIRPGLIQYAQGLQQAHIQLGRWLNSTPQHTRIAISDAGAVPYYADRYTIDLMGLNDQYLAHLPGRFGQKIDVAYVLKQQPDYLILLSSSPPNQRFHGLTPFDQAIYEAILTTYVFQKSYKFGDEYFLWVFLRGR